MSWNLYIWPYLEEVSLHVVELRTLEWGHPGLSESQHLCERNVEERPGKKAMWRQGRDYCQVAPGWGIPVASEDGGDKISHLVPPEWAWPRQYFGCELLASKPGRASISVALSYLVCGDLSQQLWETVHVVIVQSISRVQLSATPWAIARQSVVRIGICILLS